MKLRNIHIIKGALFGCALLLFAFVNPTDLSIDSRFKTETSALDCIAPKLFNFRIENAHTDRVYFDSTEPIASSSFTGFVITNKSISGITVIAAQNTGHYFELSTSFTHFDNVQIRYEGGSDLSDLNGNNLHVFEQDYVANNILEPGPTKTVYVRADATGTGDGSSEINAYTINQLNATTVQAGTRILIKKGVYLDTFTLPRSGTETQPIWFEGYSTTPGDLNYNVFHPVYPNALSGTDMPLFDGGNRNNGLKCFNFNNKRFWIFKNIQVKRHKYGWYSSYSTPSDNIIFNNCAFEEMGDVTTGYGAGFVLNMNANNNKPHNFRLINCYGRNATQSNYALAGDYHLVKNCVSYSDEDPYPGSGNLYLSTDYHIRFGDGFENTIIDCYIENVGDLEHTAHGYANRGFYLPTSYALIKNSEAVNINGAIEFRNNVTDGYAVGCIIRGGISRNEGGIHFRDGASNNTVDKCVIKDIGPAYNAALNYYDTSGEGGTGEIVNNNIVKNTIFDNVDNLLRFGNGTTGNTITNNKLLNCTVNNIYELFFVEANVSVSSFEMKNTIFNDISRYGSSTTGVTREYCNFWDFYGTNGTPPSGTGNVSVDPQFANVSTGNFTPQNIAMKAGTYLSNVVYDKDGKERNNTPTMGAIEVD